MHSGKSLRFHLLHIERAITSVFCTVAVLALLSCKSSSKKEEPIAHSNRLQCGNPLRSWPIASPGRCSRSTSYLSPSIQCGRIISTAMDTKKSRPQPSTTLPGEAFYREAVTQAPLTDPSHASIFTGTNPNVHGVRDTGGFVLQPSSVTLAAILQRDGWDTGAFVSASVLKKSFGLNQGFSTYDDQMPGSNDGSGFQRAASRPANITVDHAVSWLNAQTKRPFFLWVHLYDAHEPYNPPPQFRKQYQGDLYDAEIAFIDQQLGRLLVAVNKKSPVGRTMIVLLADHGEGLGQHGEYSHGTFLYDSTLRIPWIMVGPAIPAGLRIQQQAREIDVLPTILNLLGGKASSAVQGTSMTPAFCRQTRACHLFL